MSFKREGDDLNLLNKLKHQRVSELLGTYIPEDEAKLLSNGRLTCMICLHHPIFDTVAMLAKHRKGKKHLLELSRYIKHKQELEYEAMKKQQMDAVKALSDEMSIQSIISSRTLGGRDHTEYGRRKTLELPIFRHEKPKLPLSKSESSPSQSSASQVRRYLKTLHRKRSLESLVEQKRENYGQLSKSEQSVSMTEVKEVTINVEPLKENVNKRSTSLPSTDFSLNLSGWIKDTDGNWVKDVNAEFDSDEDTPSNQNT